MDSKFKLRLSFPSVILITTLLGFSAGVVASPILAVAALSNGSPIFITLFLSLIFSTFQGLLTGLFGFPVYWLISNKVGFKYTGEIHKIEE